MLDKRQFYRALQQAKPEIGRNLASRRSQVETAEDLRRQLQQLTFDQATSQLQTIPNKIWPGARPTPEVDDCNGFRFPFTHDWASVEASQKWAHQQLKGQPIVAVDGSQLESERGLSLSVGAVQIGYHFNDPLERKHGEGQELEIVLPLPETTMSDSEQENTGLTLAVNQARFVGECEMIPRLATRMSKPPVCFYDNTFVISFAKYMPQLQSTAYLQAVQKLLQAGRKGQYPIVAYVDTSHSRDLGHMLESLGASSPKVSDGIILQNLLTSWGDRTPFMQCARADGLSKGQDESFYYADIGFVYLRTYPAAPPARIEVPMWVYEAGRLEEVLNVVRAQCLLGTRHYPYALSQADRFAVLTLKDRRAFYSGLQGFLKEEMDFKLRRPAKAKSKSVSRLKM